MLQCDDGLQENLPQGTMALVTPGIGAEILFLFKRKNGSICSHIFKLKFYNLPLIMYFTRKLLCGCDDNKA